jgi:predicted nucleic acid-binding Zn ribbon protein
MAWETTKTKAIQDNFFKCTCGQTFDVYRYDFTCPSCGIEYSVIDIETDLPSEDCEGYCRRLR